MKQTQTTTFTRYEIARIIGARALQIAMDAPLLLKMSEDELKLMKYDALKISQKEFEEGVLPITVNRPTPKKRKEKVLAVREEKVSDEELVEKEAEEEKDIVERAEQLGFTNDDDAAEVETPSSAAEE
jgi:DNA-directed RNA polymerase subunit K